MKQSFYASDDQPTFQIHHPRASTSYTLGTTQGVPLADSRHGRRRRAQRGTRVRHLENRRPSSGHHIQRQSNLELSKIMQPPLTRQTV